jgi:hypothetical protein
LIHGSRPSTPRQAGPRPRREPDSATPRRSVRASNAGLGPDRPAGDVEWVVNHAPSAWGHRPSGCRAGAVLWRACTVEPTSRSTITDKEARLRRSGTGAQVGGVNAPSRCPPITPLAAMLVG